MSLSFLLSIKYLQSKKNSRFISAISAITIVGIALGIIVVVIALTVLDGFEKVISEKIVSMNSHIKITSFGNRNLPPSDEVIPFIDEKFGSRIEKIEPFVAKLAIIKSRKRTEGITINGVLENTKEIGISSYVAEGKFDLSSKDSLPNIILGKTLAQKLFVKPGAIVTVFSLLKDLAPSFDNPPSIQQFKVSGIYESGMSEYDDLNAFVSISMAQEIFGMENSISGFNLKIKDLKTINQLADDLQTYLGYPFYVRTIFQIHQNIFTWLDLQKEPIPIVLGLIIFVAVFNIIGTLLIIVLERTNSVGILRSLGANKKLIMKVFLYHSLFITSIGIIAGNFLAYLFSILQLHFNIITLPGKVYFVSKVPMAINIENYLLVTAVTFCVSLLASMIPAFVAMKIKPISAIRFN
jgi:lipoprotein-releasing system permease protein